MAWEILLTSMPVTVFPSTDILAIEEAISRTDIARSTMNDHQVPKYQWLKPSPLAVAKQRQRYAAVTNASLARYAAEKTLMANLPQASIIHKGSAHAWAAARLDRSRRSIGELLPSLVIDHVHGVME